MIKFFYRPSMLCVIIFSFTLVSNSMSLESAFGQVLKEERRRMKLTQANLAEFADLDNNTIGLYERGLMQPGLKTFFKIAKALNVAPEFLAKRIKEILYDRL